MRTHRTSRIRTLALAAAGLAAALSLTACNGSDDASDANSSTPSGSATATASGSASGGKATGGSAGTSTGTSTSTPAKSTGKTSGGTTGGTAGDDSTTGDKTGYGQACGTNDLTWSTKSESQAGGYILVMAKAKPGIKCILSGDLPVVAFGSDGTQASNAEQAVGEQVTLSGSTVAYAGVNPKTTNTSDGKELDSIIVSVSDDDPNPVSLKVGTITVDKPIVTNWHTSASAAVPGDGTDN
ncbi:hypothetical protein [Streptomyces sp. SAS_270]|uniref:hypothetical protein n=1 Tax=Streptomyces sp. SAS_270 TaxID=3412748 RepID=UPI00403CD3AF